MIHRRLQRLRRSSKVRLHLELIERLVTDRLFNEACPLYGDQVSALSLQLLRFDAPCRDMRRSRAVSTSISGSWYAVCVCVCL